MKVYDCIPFHQEVDMLNVRLHELDAVVDVFILVEATRTFSGLPKPLHFLANKTRFKKFWPKIVYFAIEYPSLGPSAWSRDFYHKNFPGTYLKQVAQEEDLILSCDLDEIPNPGVVEKLKHDPASVRNPQSLLMDFYYYHLNWICASPWKAPYICRLAHLQKWSLQDMRDLSRLNHLEEIPEAGWHLSYFFPPKEIAYKIKSFAHQEFNRPEYTDEEYIRKSISEGIDLFRRKDAIEKKFVRRTTQPLPKHYTLLPSEFWPEIIE